MGVTEDVSQYLENLPNWGKAVVAGGVSLVIYAHYKWLTSKERKTPLKEDWKEGIVYLYQFPRTKNIPSLSPYCLKVETWLRMTEINYEIVPCSLSTRSLEGTLPFVELNGKEYGDSAFIMRFGEREKERERERERERDFRDLTKVLEKKLEDHLSDEQQAAARAFEKMVELSLYQSHYTFMIEHVDKVLELLPPQLFGGAFYPLLVMLMKRGFVKTKQMALTVSGVGKHSREEQIGIGLDDLKAISKYLGAKHYFTGFKPTGVDATLFSILSQIAFAPYESAHLDLMRNDCPNLLEYVERIKHRYWPDWGEATTTFSTDSNWKKRPRKESPKRDTPAH